MIASLTTIARRLSFIRETEGPNRGNWVSMLQRFCNGQDGDSWCSDFASFCCDVAYHGRPPIHKSGSSHQRLTEARLKSYVVTDPRPDDLYYFVDVVGHAHHEGIVSFVSLVTGEVSGIAGNTSEDGLSANGTGVFEHVLNVSPSRIVFVRLPRA